MQNSQDGGKADLQKWVYIEEPLNQGKVKMYVGYNSIWGFYVRWLYTMRSTDDFNFSTKTNAMR